jgi:hypothetical protein
MFGSEIPPKGPQQDMFEIDVIAGGPADDRRGAENDFTGASGPAGLHGLGGEAEPATSTDSGARAGAPGTIEPNTVYERIGF